MRWSNCAMARPTAARSGRTTARCSRSRYRPAATGPDGFCAAGFYTSGQCGDVAGYAEHEQRPVSRRLSLRRQGRSRNARRVGDADLGSRRHAAGLGVRLRPRGSRRSRRHGCGTERRHHGDLSRQAERVQRGAATPVDERGMPKRSGSPASTTRTTISTPTPISTCCACSGRCSSRRTIRTASRPSSASACSAIRTRRRPRAGRASARSTTTSPSS